MPQIDDKWVRTTKSDGETAHWYSPTLCHTMSASAWWRLLRTHGFRMRLSRLPVAVSITFSTAGNALLGMAQSILYRARLRHTKIEHDPIFILGHWRSGTTHLHELLALDDRYTFPTTYECFAPHHCLITDHLYPKLFSWLLPRKRVMDGMAVGFDRPQEDEFALVALGAPSPMWSIAYPGEKQGQGYLTLRDVSELGRERWADVLLKFLRLLTYRRPGRPLILKSPAHTARLALLARMFPKARFVHIVRDPYAVFASTVHLWRTMQSVSALTRPSDPVALQKYVLESLKEMYQEFEVTRLSLPPGRFHQLRYEDLIREPIPTLEKSYQAIGLGDFEIVRSQVNKYLAALGAYRSNEYETSAAVKMAVREAWGEIFKRWGYEI